MDKYSFNKNIDTYANVYELSAAEPYLDFTNFPLDMHSIKIRSGVDPSFVNMYFRSKGTGWYQEYEKASQKESEKLIDRSFFIHFAK